MLVYIGFADKKIKLRPRHFLRLSAPLLADYAKGGTPVILSNAMWGVAMAVQTAILGHLSQTVIAANSIATTVFQIVSVICYGAASAAAVLIGKTVGSGSSLEKIKGYTKTLQALFVAIGLATGLTLFFAKDAILQFYAVSPETKQLAAWFITILSVSVCGTSYQVACLTGIVRGEATPSLCCITTPFSCGLSSSPRRRFRPMCSIFRRGGVHLPEVRPNFKMYCRGGKSKPLHLGSKINPVTFRIEGRIYW